MARTLSEDIHLVGDTLGDVLRSHGSEALFERVEAMRTAAIEARELEPGSDPESYRERLAILARDLDPQMARDVARAFTLYFQLINLCEDVHRVRTLRAREMTGDVPEGSFHDAMARLAREGLSREEALQLLDETSISYVFTAHPTEARRRTTERLLAEVRRTLSRRDREELAPRDLRREDRALKAAVEALWEHSAERHAKPEVLDEVKAGLWYLDHVLLDVLPRTQRRLWWAFEDTFGSIDAMELSVLARFGSWMGGDRDGNPFVNDAVTERTLETQRRIILDRYHRDLVHLADALSADAERVPENDDLARALVRAASAVPEIAKQTTERHPDEPLRRLLRFVIERIERTRLSKSGGYHRPEDFIGDLLALRSALNAAGAVALPNDRLLDLIQRVRCFGFHLVTLDLREDSEEHRMVIAELLGDSEYPSRSPEERQTALAKLQLPANPASLSERARRLLDLFASIPRFHRRFGKHATPTYIISMTSSATDVIEALSLARLHGVADALDIVPLLETPDDLANAGPLLEALFSHPEYAAHLERRGRTQELLVGYSDSMKKGGILASRIRVADAQKAASRVCQNHGVRLRVFHGRGGSVSRGGGPTHRAIEALPLDAFSGAMKITEQGEMRAANFANPDLAVRYLEQTLGAAITTRARARRVTSEVNGDTANDDALLDRLAAASRKAYEDLVETDGFVQYFREATPFEQISNLRIGSRPAKRRGRTAGVNDLRAIPWVFSWSQARHVITGWYGVGAALDGEDGESLRALVRRSRFFRDLIDNVEMTLAKTELGIASRYAELCEDSSVRERIFGAIRDEFERTQRAVLRVTQRHGLLDADPWLQRSIRLRNPYIDPLSYLQVEALRRLRDGEPGWDEVARVAVQGIAAGVRITG